MRRSHCNFCTACREQAGVGLIEVLIAVLVLAFGMLGLAGLQVWSLKNNQSAMERGLAVVQTHSIVDAMHADRATAVSGGFNLAIDAAVPAGATFALGALATWRANLIITLGPQATGSIACPVPANGNPCTVRIRWNDQRGTEGSAQQELATQVQL